MTQQQYSSSHKLFSRFAVVLVVLYCVQWVPLGLAQPVTLNFDLRNGAATEPMTQLLSTCHGSQIPVVTEETVARKSAPASNEHLCCKQGDDGCSMLNCMGLLALATTNFLVQLHVNHNADCFYDVSYRSLDALSLFRPPASA